MKTRIRYIVYGILLLMVSLSSCSDSEVIPTPGLTAAVKRIPVTLPTAIPLTELPSSRAITDDSAINNYVIWVFSNEKFVEAIKSGETYEEDGKQYPKVDLKDNGNLYILLPENLTNVTLAMIANVEVASPAVDTSVAVANGTFSAANLTYMPMYGVNSQKFNVALGADGGIIVLRRSMAKVEVHTSNAKDHFKLEEMSVYHANSEGKVKEESTMTNKSAAKPIIAEIGTDLGYVYLPEIDLSVQNEKSFVIIKGKYKNEETSRYYKLDFIQQVETNDGVAYQSLPALKRNYRYVFDIQYLTDGAGYTNLNDAIENEACNKAPENSTKLIKIHDEQIMDITTNNYIYLGVTAGEVPASSNDNYYVANVSIVTNSEKGWKFEDLPSGVSVSIPAYNSGNTDVVSVWVFLDKNTYSTGQSVTIYVYGENIRKSITVTVP